MMNATHETPPTHLDARQSSGHPRRDLRRRHGTDRGRCGTYRRRETTLAYLIPRYHAASEGQVLIDGHDVNDVTIESLRGQISYVFQETQTTVASILENIRLGKPDATTEEVERAARAAGIHDFIVSLPDGYDTMLGATSSK